jgi:4-amino-4-deoxychorismate lyase
MSRFIESIRFEKGSYQLLEFHQERINATYRKFFPLTIPFHLAAHLPKLDFEKTYKVSVVYSNDSIDIEFAEYLKRKVTSLRIIEEDKVDYSFKFEARTKIEQLYVKRHNADDIIIIKKGLVTDSSYANLVFWDGNLWYTPKSHLLNGVKRQYYLRTGLISEKEITLKTLFDYKKVSLINSMLDLGDVEVSIDKIVV